MIERILDYRFNEWDWDAPYPILSKEQSKFTKTTWAYKEKFDIMKDDLFDEFIKKEFGDTLKVDARHDQTLRIRTPDDTSPYEEQFVFRLKEENPDVKEVVIEMCKFIITTIYGGTCKFTGFGYQNYLKYATKKSKKRTIPNGHSSWFTIIREYR